MNPFDRIKLTVRCYLDKLNSRTTPQPADQTDTAFGLDYHLNHFPTSDTARGLLKAGGASSVLADAAVFEGVHVIHSGRFFDGDEIIGLCIDPTGPNDHTNLIIVIGNSIFSGVAPRKTYANVRKTLAPSTNGWEKRRDLDEGLAAISENTRFHEERSLELARSDHADLNPERSPDTGSQPRSLDNRPDRRCQGHPLEDFSAPEFGS